jgi:exonuclease III
MTMDRSGLLAGSVTSLNCNGLGGKKKRLEVYKWLKRNHKGIILLQESHCTPKRETSWGKTFGRQYTSYYSNGSSRSCGVITFLPERLGKYVKDQDRDTEGRCLIISLEIKTVKYAIINIYAPNQDSPAAQMEFLDFLDSKLEKYKDHTILMGGDFNMVLNPTLDRYKCKDTTPTKPEMNLIKLISNHNLSDIWRTRNPTTIKYTWRRDRPSLQQSRIDLIFVSNAYQYNIDSTNIETGYESDHCIVKIILKDVTRQQRGNGYWKFNTGLLGDQSYIALIENLLEKLEGENNKDECPRLTWDTLKMILRRETISYSKRKAKHRRKERKKLVKDLEELEEKITDPHVSQDILDLYKSKMEEWKQFEREATRGAILRSKSQWVEQGEKSSKFFLNLEKHNQELKAITKLQYGADNFDHPDDILSHILDFYKNLYAPVANESESDKTIYNDNLLNFQSDKKISTEDSDYLDGVITERELYEAVMSMPNDKSPGTDGLSAEFYKRFWKHLKKPLIKCFRTVYEKEELSIDQKTGIISLIPKAEKDPLQIKNWRPITILNVDYKILTKALAFRLKPVLPKIIHQDQCGFVMDRLIGENIRIVDDLIKYCDKEGIEGLLVFLDFEKAFDSLDWRFIQHSLREFGFGPNFMKWIKILYNNIVSMVSNNGNLSETFLLKRGIRQGCPISPYIFIICAELLSQKIRESQISKGLLINNHEFKILQFADDTVLIMNDTDSLRAALKIVKEFSSISGLRINRSKTEIYNLGKTDQNPELKKIGLKISESPIRYLGIWFSKDKHTKEYKNFRHKLEKNRKPIKVSLKGKITVLKSLAISQLVFPLSMLSAPEEVIHEAEVLMYDFLWDGKPERIKRNTVIRNISEGGLKMIDIRSMIDALKISWITKFYDKDDKKWKVIPNLLVGKLSIEEFATCSYNSKMIPKTLPIFYIECLESLLKCRAFDSHNKDDLLNETLWMNKNITVGGKPLFYKLWYDKGIKIIGDIVDHKGELLQPDILEAKYDLNLTNFLEYYSLRQAIPGFWKLTLKDGSSNLSERYSMPNIMDGMVKKPLKIVSTNKIYWRLVTLKTSKRITSLHYWEEQSFINNSNMSKYFRIPFVVTSETKMQSMQYKIFHNQYITRERLFQWKRKDEPYCLDCGEKDSLIHHFAHCQIMTRFWNSFANWWHIMCPTCDPINDIDITIGRINGNCHFTQLNYVLISARWYIYRQKYREESCFFLEFLSELKNKLVILKLILTRNNKYEEFLLKWGELFDLL